MMNIQLKVNRQMDLNYLKWLRNLFQDELVKAYPNTSTVCLRNGTWRTFYLGGWEPSAAAVELLPSSQWTTTPKP
jgi:hypothetical protein